MWTHGLKRSWPQWCPKTQENYHTSLLRTYFILFVGLFLCAAEEALPDVVVALFPLEVCSEDVAKFALSHYTERHLLFFCVVGQLKLIKAALLHCVCGATTQAAADEQLSALLPSPDNLCSLEK